MERHRCLGFYIKPHYTTGQGRWYKFVPVFHGLQGRSALKSRLREVLIIGQYITVHRRIKVFPWSKVMTLEDILYTPVESFNHAVCLRRLWWGQAMVDEGDNPSGSHPRSSNSQAM